MSGLTTEEIARALQNGPYASRAVISPRDLAAILGRSVKTIYLWIADGKLDGTFCKQGKHILIWRDRAIQTILNLENP